MYDIAQSLRRAFRACAAHSHPVFIPDGYDVTAAEITEEEKNAISHRGKALRAMADYLKSR